MKCVLWTHMLSGCHVQIQAWSRKPCLNWQDLGNSSCFRAWELSRPRPLCRNTYFYLLLDFSIKASRKAWFSLQIPSILWWPRTQHRGWHLRLGVNDGSSGRSVCRPATTKVTSSPWWVNLLPKYSCCLNNGSCGSAGCEPGSPKTGSVSVYN